MSSSPTAVVSASLGYAPAERVEVDDERPPLLRARTVDGDRAAAFTFEPCAIRDLDAADDPPRFHDAGFEAVRLPAVTGMQELLEQIRDAAAVTDDQIERLRGLLEGGVLRLGDGSALRIEHVADEGVIRRVAGPDGRRVDGHEHTAADAVHIDQDVQGTPLRQLFSGGASEFFCHRSPDGANTDSDRHLVNLWIPLRQVTRPLTLMDGRTLDRPRHQLRYRLPVDGFLDRDPDATVNDIWQCRHDPSHEWWFRSAPAIGDAYVFDTLSTPHTSFVVPGEDVAADRYERLGRAVEAAGAGDLDGARVAAGEGVGSAAEAATAPLRAAIEHLDEVAAELDGLAADGTAGWIARAEAARAAVVRRSIELRAVVSRIGPEG